MRMRCVVILAMTHLTCVVLILGFTFNILKLEGFGIRLNKKPPLVTVKKKEKGGISVTNTVPLTKITPDEIRAVCMEYRLNVSSKMLHPSLLHSD